MHHAFEPPLTAVANPRVRRLLQGGLAIALASAMSSAARAQPAPVAASVPPDLDELKAAYLYKFVSFVDWPATAFRNSESPIVIAVVGNEPVYDHLAHMVLGRSVQGRLVTVRKIGSGDTAAAADASLLFVAGNLSARKEWEQRVGGHPVLWVTDVPGGLTRGSLINFILVDGRLRFEASLPAIERSGLSVSSRLLSLAETVLTKP